MSRPGRRRRTRRSRRRRHGVSWSPIVTTVAVLAVVGAAVPGVAAQGWHLPSVGRPTSVAPTGASNDGSGKGLGSDQGPASRARRWLDTYRGQPVAWPCGQVSYVLVAAGAPRGAQAFVADAFTMLQQASGNTMRFNYQGEVPELADAPAGAITVGWAGSDQEPWRGNQAGVDRNTGSGAAYEQAVVKLRSGRPYSNRLGFTGDDVGPILLHELGHAVGLAHTGQNADSLMTPIQSRDSFSRADRAALSYLGKHCSI